MSEWKLYKISEIATLSNGINFDKSAYGHGIKLIGVADFKNRIFPDYDNLQEVDSKVVRSGDYLQKGDIVFVRSNGNKELVGRCMMIDKDTPLTFSGFCINLRLNDKTTFNPVFLNYLFKTSNFRKNMIGTAVGANIQNLSQSRLGNCVVSVPSSISQTKIATFLLHYDNLIANYQQQIKLLEETAQRLYKEWFIDLRFPGHENTEIVDGVPEGWVKKPLGSIVQKSIGGGWGKESRQGSYDKSAYVVRGTDISKLKNGSPDDIPFRYHTDSNLKERVLSDGDIIFEVSGGSEKEPVGRLYFITQQILDFYKERVICASFCKKVSFEDKNSSLLAYYAMQYCRESGDMKKYEKDSAGNIINFAWSTFLDDFIVLVPDKHTLELFCERVQAIINNLVNLSLQIRTLTEARDRLLPKLMSGEIEIE